MWKQCQIVSRLWLLSTVSIIQEQRSLAVPRMRRWSVSLLRRQARSGPLPTDVGFFGRVKKISTCQQPSTSPRGPKKLGSPSREAIDALFADTAGGALGAKFDAVVDKVLPGCSIVEIANFVRIAGKKSRDNTASHMMRRLPDIASNLDLLASSAWKYKEISFILYGLQSCKESNDGYLRIMMTMSRIAVSTVLRKESISSQNLSMILYGLRSNKFKHKESKEMLSCLPRIVEKCTEPLNAQAVGNALYGLKGMSSDNAEVRSLVRVLVGQVERCREPLDAQTVGNALYGLQGMSSDNADVRSLVRVLVGQVERCREPLDAQTVGNALYGLQGMFSSLVDYTPEHISCGSSVVMSLQLLRDHLTLSEVKECESIITDIERKAIASSKGGDPAISASFQSRSEQRMHIAMMKALGESNMRVSHNEHLFGLFECDIVVRIPRAVDARTVREDREGHADGREDCLIVNIEVDGVHHRREKKKRFCRLRDGYLQSRGVVIERMEVSALDAMSEQELKKWVMDVTAKALQVQ